MKTELERKTLDALCHIDIGKTPSRAIAGYWDTKRSSDNIWVSISDLTATKNGHIDDSRERLTDLGARLCKKVAPGTLLLSFKLTLGRVAFARVPLYTNEAIAAITPRSAATIDRFYLGYYFRFFDWEAATRGDHKVKGRTFNKAKLKAIRIPLPSLREQQRIVSILDEAFESIATAKTSTEMNVANVRTLFQGELDSTFLRLSVSERVQELGNVITLQNGDRGRNYPSRSKRTTQGIPFINAGHLVNGRVDTNALDYVSREHFLKLSNGKIQPGDVLFCLRGSVGKSASVGGLQEGAIASSLVIVRPSTVIDHRFLLAYFDSCLSAAMINDYRNGAAQPNLSAKLLARFRIPVPSVEQQGEVIRYLDALRERTQQLLEIYQRRLGALGDLKQSLLRAAFNGDL